MKTADERLDALEPRVTALEKRNSEISWAERDILKAARQWARLEKLGHMIDDDGNRVLLSERERLEMAEWFAKQIKAHALALLRAESAPSEP